MTTTHTTRSELRAMAVKRTRALMRSAVKLNRELELIGGVAGLDTSPIDSLIRDLLKFKPTKEK